MNESNNELLREIAGSSDVTKTTNQLLREIRDAGLGGGGADTGALGELNDRIAAIENQLDAVKTYTLLLSGL